MSAAFARDEGDRHLMFLFEDVQYAMPIAWVVEVAEKNRVTSVPSLSLPVGGVMTVEVPAADAVMFTLSPLA